MPTQAEAEAYRETQGNLVAVAQAALVAWWADLPGGLPIESISTALRRFLPSLVQTYGSASATVAADWYDDLRDDADVPGMFSAEVAEPVTMERAEAGARWATAPTKTVVPDPDAPDDMDRATVERRDPTPEQVLDKSSLVVQRFVQEPGRNTITDSALADPGRPRWARSPQGDTCAWCLVLASRGAVYLTRETANEMNRYHNACDCQPTPTWDDSLPYDADALYSVYNEARSGANSGDIKAVTAWLRENRGLR